MSYHLQSFRGIYARFAIKELYQQNKSQIAGLTPQYFVTIATPHLGVGDYNYLSDELQLKVPFFVKKIVSAFFSKSGYDLILTATDGSNSDSGNSNINTGLMYKMCTNEEFLVPQTTDTSP